MRRISALLLRSFTALPKATSVWRRFPIGSVPLRTQYGIWARPQYAYGTFHAARQAKLLGLPGITVVEYGVAQGNGLLALENIAHEVGEFFKIRISVFGFDTGAGLPAPTDYRDLPHIWSRGLYTMDESALRRKLHPSTQLLIGDIQHTIEALADIRDPLGFVVFDMDYYTSTKQAFRAFDFSQSTRLPRVYCYFDDILYPELACHNAWTGELCAIREFNEQHADLKISPIHGLRWFRPHPEPWNDQMYALHDFHHPLYAVNILDEQA
jgi:hypothetical protein